jgi:hypothetical protein
MPKREHDHDKHRDREKHEHPRARRDGKDRQVILDITARRMAGGVPATPQAYAKALEQWRKLPGAVMSPPTDLRPALANSDSGESEKPVADAGGDERKS